MKTYSTIPIESPVRWKDGEYLVAINHKENPVNSPEDEGKRFEADFTIATGTDEQSVLKAFERSFNDAQHDQRVIDAIEIDGQSAISVVKEYPADAPKILSVSILNDNLIEKQPESLKALNNDADGNIKKLAGKVKNYVADLTKGKRTVATDTEVNQLIADGNIIITNQ